MHAAVGGTIGCAQPSCRDADRHAMILEVEGEGGEPPYRRRDSVDAVKVDFPCAVLARRIL
jgi:hypothetical protein